MEDLAIELQKIYESEINIRISWLWDGGIDLWLGDDVGGFEATEGVKSVADIVPWLQEAIAHFYPRSTYVQSLDAEVIERAQSRWCPQGQRLRRRRGGSRDFLSAGRVADKPLPANRLETGLIRIRYLFALLA